MPCNDGMNNSRTEYVEKLHDGENAARLCAVLSFLEENGKLDLVIENANWKKAGVSRQSTLAWWEEHKKRDEAKVKAEKKAKAEREKAEALLTKPIKELTADEFKLLRRYDLLQF